MKEKSLDDTTQPPDIGDLIPYYMCNASDDSIEPWCYNDATKWGSYDQIRAQSEGNDPFGINKSGTIPSRYTLTCHYASRS